MDNKCTSPKLAAFKGLLAYMSQHYYQSAILVFALSLGFLLAVGAVGYAMILQSQGGCLTFFTQHVPEISSDN